MKMQVKYINFTFCTLFFLLKFVSSFDLASSLDLASASASTSITSSQIIAESSIIFAKCFPFLQLHVAGFQT